jgi:hypothetical protein
MTWMIEGVKVRVRTYMKQASCRLIKLGRDSVMEIAALNQFSS